MNYQFALPGGTKLRFLTAGTYCDRDILVSGEGHTDADLKDKYDQGLEAGTAICAAKHFVCNFVGDGSGSASFHVPFEPDAVLIFAFSPFVAIKSYALALFACDCRAFGRLGGFGAYGTSTGSLNTSMLTTTSVLKRYSRAEDGTITVKDISASVVFDPTYTYTAIAVKYTDQTDKERIADYVNELTGSGTVVLNQAKVEAAFTDDEWAALIATKPNWTFTWI